MQKPLNLLNRSSLKIFLQQEAPAKGDKLDKEMEKVIQSLKSVVLHKGMSYKLPFSLGYLKKQNATTVKLKSNYDNISTYL